MHFPTTSYILLGMLSSQEMSGYDLTQQGWATATEVPQTHRPDKRVYRITPAGRAALQQWLVSPDVESDSFKSPLLLRLFFGHLVPHKILMTRLETRRQQLVEELAVCKEEEQRLRDQMQEPRAKAQLVHFFLTLRFHMDMLHAARQWTDEAIEELTGWEASATSVRQAAGA